MLICVVGEYITLSYNHLKDFIDYVGYELCRTILEPFFLLENGFSLGEK